MLRNITIHAMPRVEVDHTDDALRTLPLAHGHTLVLTEAGDRASIAASGVSEPPLVEILIGTDGVRLVLHACDLVLATSGALAISADTLALHGRRGMTLTTDGDAKIAAAGSLESSGRSQSIRSTRGDVRVSANDDVHIQGERVRLNS